MFGYQIDETLKLVLPQSYHAEEITTVVRENLDILEPWLPWATDDYSVATAVEYVNKTRREYGEKGTFGTLIVLDGNVVGAIGCHKLNPVNKSIQIGYWLGKTAQGRGVVTKCCRVLVDYIFDKMLLNRVQINCNVENRKSRAIPERLNFQLEGIHRQVEFHHGRFGDWAIYAMLREDWKSEK